MKTFLPLLLSLTVAVSSAYSISRENLPKELQEVPFGEDTGLITSVKRIQIPGYKFAYNGSILPYADHYLMFFRFDKPVLPPFTSQLGVVSLDENFDPVHNDVTVLSTNSLHSEDPRAFWHKDKIQVSFSDVHAKQPGKILIHLAQVHPYTFEVEKITNFDINLHKVEKNWTPFVNNDSLMYIYYIYPQKNFCVIDQDEEKSIEVALNEKRPIKRSCYWKKCFGQIRGGTPAVQITDDEYISFFHSSFQDEKGFRWYVMGAYTFDVNPPHKILRVSKQPILYHSIYDTWTYHRDKFCIFPAGLIVDGDRVIVSCGENDTSIKVVTFDKEKLLDSLTEAIPQGRAKFTRYNY